MVPTGDRSDSEAPHTRFELSFAHNLPERFFSTFELVGNVYSKSWNRAEGVHAHICHSATVTWTNRILRKDARTYRFWMFH
ncbi:hypothetical protein SCP_0213320 [Sparassis crispa]|uniref:Uncharacterized protein n=1 Tax=Sparassis crispa TaxID=139825 RepID=A0A401GD66_9APHY|nr:hypothetical protein SCP_0213320 [Sparassis crispa]GBE80129.1 hypothetical protein SCP_0213320 [Sparassis crispa]